MSIHLKNICALHFPEVWEYTLAEDMVPAVMKLPCKTSFESRSILPTVILSTVYQMMHQIAATERGSLGASNWTFDFYEGYKETT